MADYNAIPFLFRTHTVGFQLSIQPQYLRKILMTQFSTKFETSLISAHKISGRYQSVAQTEVPIAEVRLKLQFTN